jgi:hypothetical protein
MAAKPRARRRSRSDVRLLWVILVPEWRPSFAGTGVFFVYVLSIPFMFLGLLGLAIWGMVGAISRRGDLRSKKSLPE